MIPKTYKQIKSCIDVLKMKDRNKSIKSTFIPFKSLLFKYLYH